SFKTRRVKLLRTGPVPRRGRIEPWRTIAVPRRGPQTAAQRLGSGVRAANGADRRGDTQTDRGRGQGSDRPRLAGTGAAAGSGLLLEHQEADPLGPGLGVQELVLEG